MEETKNVKKNRLDYGQTIEEIELIRNKEDKTINDLFIIKNFKKKKS